MWTRSESHRPEMLQERTFDSRNGTTRHELQHILPYTCKIQNNTTPFHCTVQRRYNTLLRAGLCILRVPVFVLPHIPFTNSASLGLAPPDSHLCDLASCYVCSLGSLRPHSGSGLYVLVLSSLWIPDVLDTHIRGIPRPEFNNNLRFWALRAT